MTSLDGILHIYKLEKIFHLYLLIYKLFIYQGMRFTIF